MAREKLTTRRYNRDARVTIHENDMVRLLGLGHTVHLLSGNQKPLGSLLLAENADGGRRICFIPSELLQTLETPTSEWFAAWLTAERKKCVHRLTAGDVPPGMDPDDIMLHCENDPECPKKQGGTK